MGLFQTSVLQTYLAQQDHKLIETAYNKYSKYFHNITIQENIKNSKEEPELVIKVIKKMISEVE